MRFVPTRWNSYLRPIKRETKRETKSTDGKGNKGSNGNTSRHTKEDLTEVPRRYYELCVLWELRIALRASNIWV